MQFDKLSFCMTTFNKQELLKVTLANYLQNRQPNYELIISDGFSTDGTVDYLTQLYTENKIERVITSDKRDNGEWEGYKKTLAHATGSYLYFLSDDDYFDFKHIDQIFSYILSNVQIDYLIANGIDLRYNGAEYLDYHSAIKNANSMKTTENRLGDGTCGLGIFVRNEVAKQLNLFSNKYGKRTDKTLTLELMNSDFIGASCSFPAYVSIKNEKSNSHLYGYNYKYIEQQEVLQHEPNKEFQANVEHFEQRFNFAKQLIKNYTNSEFKIYN